MIAALVFTLVVHTEFTPWEMIWSFSLWLESVAIMPQINILSRQNKVENFTAHYIAALGSYRFFYILHWIQRYVFDQFICWTSVCSGVVQTLLYADFFYLYIRKYFLIKNSIKQQITTDLPTNMKITDE